MRLFLLVMLTTPILLFQSCVSKLSEIRDDIGTLAKNGAAISKAVKEIPAQVEASVNKAKTDLLAKGAPVDGTPADLIDWAKQNPGAAIGSPMAFLLVLFAAWRRARTAQKGLTAAVDAVEALPADARAAFKAEAEKSAHMTPDVSALIASLKAR